MELAPTETFVPDSLPPIFPVTLWHDVYPGIDPKPHYDAQTYRDKVVLITGCSRGIGKEVAIFYARSGASLVLVAQTKSTLEQVKHDIGQEVLSARVEVFPADVSDSKQIGAATSHAIKVFGKLDIAIANAGICGPFDKPFTEKDPDQWWRILEVNLRGVYNVAHFALPHLDKTKGYLVVTSSAFSYRKKNCASAYCVSKHAIGRLIELVKLEHPEVKSFAVHPGMVPTDMSLDGPSHPHLIIDTLQLPAATYLRLTSGNFDWFNGRYLEANWDLDEIESNWKQKIIEQDALINQLSLPS